MKPLSQRLASLINAVAEASTKNQPAILAVLQDHAAALISEIETMEAGVAPAAEPPPPLDAP
jgi:hypothetical protein